MTEFEQPPHGLPDPPDGHRWCVTYLENGGMTTFHLDLIKTKKHWLTGRTVDDRAVFSHQIASYYTDSVAGKVESGIFERTLLVVAEQIMLEYDKAKDYKKALSSIGKMIRKDDLR